MDSNFGVLFNFSTKINGNVVSHNKRFDALEQKIDALCTWKAEIKTINAKVDQFFISLIAEKKAKGLKELDPLLSKMTTLDTMHYA